MTCPYLLTSMTRIAPLADSPFTVRTLDRPKWETGDYILARVEEPDSADPTIELCDGRLIEATAGDLIIGALGKRYATLEATGDWEQIGPDGKLHALTEGGLLGACLTRSKLVRPLLPLSYQGHVFLAGKPARMADHAVRGPLRILELPVVMIIGSSMSAGKTTTARVVIRLLKRLGLRVLAAKLTGAGRYHDILEMKDAGADAVFDFVDAGLPSTIGPVDAYREAMVPLLGKIAEQHADVAVIETGASPLEPYNSDTAISLIEPCIRMTILSTGDPYAALGVMTAFNLRPDLVTGLATNTDAGISLIRKLTDVDALNVRSTAEWPRLTALLRDRLSLLPPEGAGRRGDSLS